MEIRVLLADDHALVRDGVAALLKTEADLVVVGGAANGSEAAQLTRELEPDVVVLDIVMPLLNGIEATEQICRDSPKTKVIILSVHSSTEHIFRAFRAGATGYLLKESAGAEVITAIRTVYAGRHYLTQRIADTVLDDFLNERGDPLSRDAVAELSPREREILQLVAEGHSSREIALRLHLSPRTVETYRSRLMHKLDLDDLPSLVRFAIEHGLTPLQ